MKNLIRKEYYHSYYQQKDNQQMKLNKGEQNQRKSWNTRMENIQNEQIAQYANILQPITASFQQKQNLSQDKDNNLFNHHNARLQINDELNSLEDNQEVQKGGIAEEIKQGFPIRQKLLENREMINQANSFQQDHINIMSNDNCKLSTTTEHQGDKKILINNLIANSTFKENSLDQLENQSFSVEKNKQLDSTNSICSNQKSNLSYLQKLQQLQNNKMSNVTRSKICQNKKNQQKREINIDNISLQYNCFSSQNKENNINSRCQKQINNKITNGESEKVILQQRICVTLPNSTKNGSERGCNNLPNSTKNSSNEQTNQVTSSYLGILQSKGFPKKSQKLNFEEWFIRKQNRSVSPSLSSAISKQKQKSNQFSRSLKNEDFSFEIKEDFSPSRNVNKQNQSNKFGFSNNDTHLSHFNISEALKSQFQKRSSSNNQSNRNSQTFDSIPLMKDMRQSKYENNIQKNEYSETQKSIQSKLDSVSVVLFDKLKNKEELYINCKNKQDDIKSQKHQNFSKKVHDTQNNNNKNSSFFQKKISSLQLEIYSPSQRCKSEIIERENCPPQCLFNPTIAQKQKFRNSNSVIPSDKRQKSKNVPSFQNKHQSKLSKQNQSFESDLNQKSKNSSYFNYHSTNSRSTTPTSHQHLLQKIDLNMQLKISTIVPFSQKKKLEQEKSLLQKERKMKKGECRTDVIEKENKLKQSQLSQLKKQDQKITEERTLSTFNMRGKNNYSTSQNWNKSRPKTLDAQISQRKQKVLKVLRAAAAAEQIHKKQEVVEQQVNINRNMYPSPQLDLNHGSIKIPSNYSQNNLNLLSQQESNEEYQQQEAQNSLSFKEENLTLEDQNFLGMKNQNNILSYFGLTASQIEALEDLSRIQLAKIAQSSEQQQQQQQQQDCQKIKFIKQEYSPELLNYKNYNRQFHEETSNDHQAISHMNSLNYPPIRNLSSNYQFKSEIDFQQHFSKLNQNLEDLEEQNQQAQPVDIFLISHRDQQVLNDYSDGDLNEVIADPFDSSRCQSISPSHRSKSPPRAGSNQEKLTNQNYEEEDPLNSLSLNKINNNQQKKNNNNIIPTNLAPTDLPNQVEDLQQAVSEKEAEIASLKMQVEDLLKVLNTQMSIKQTEMNQHS